MKVAFLLAAVMLLVVAPARADEAAAQREYKSALDHVRAGDLRAAREAFEAAYRESPHFLVLYNLARVYQDLGDRDDARHYLQRYLAEGGAAIPAARRAEVERELAALAPEAPPTEADRAQADSATKHAARAPVAPGSGGPPSAVPASPSGLRPPVQPPGRRAPDARAVSRARWSGFSLALAGTGSVLLGVSAGVLIWDRERYADWERERRALGAIGSVTVDGNDDGSSLRAAQAVQARADRNDALAESVRDFDRVGWIGVASGGALVAAAAAVWLGAGEGIRFVASGDSVDLHVAF